MASTSPPQPAGQYRIVPSTAAQPTPHHLPAGSAGTTAGIVVKLIEAQLYRILLLQAQRSIQLRTEMPLRTGQIIELVRDPRGAYQTAKPTVAPLEVINHTLRYTLPAQRPLASLLNKWLATQRLPSPQASPVTPKVSDSWILLTRLLREIPSRQQMQRPAVVRRQILNNGIFHESVATKKVPSDLKGSMLRLLEHVHRSIRAAGADRPSVRPNYISTAAGKTLTANVKFGHPQPTIPDHSVATRAFPAPGSPASSAPARNPSSPRTLPAALGQAVPGDTGRNEQVARSPVQPLRRLLVQLHQAVARIQALQLQSLVQQLAGRESNQWFMEIPVRSDDQIDVFGLQIRAEPFCYAERDSESEPQPGPARSKQPKKWTIKLEFDLPGLGPMAANLTIINKSVSLSIWAEQQSTYETAQAHLGELESNLRKQQLELDQISCHRGTSPWESPRPDSAKPGTYTSEAAPYEVGPAAYTAKEDSTSHQFQFSALIDLKT